MLRFLAELRFLSLPQLAKLCCPSERQYLSEKSARRHMREMFDAGLVDVLPVSRAALAPLSASNDASLLYGSAPNVYVPTSQGLRLLCQAGLIEEELLKRPAPSYGLRNSLFLAHELQVRDVRVWLEDCARVGGHEVEHWRDGEEAAISLDPSKAPRSVRPDAWFVLRLHRAVLVGLVEVDRGTERGDRRWREKLNAFAALFAGEYLSRATGYLNARVLVITPDAQRRDRLAKAVGEFGGTLASRFWATERGTLEETSLLTCRWRQPDDQSLKPLVPDAR